MLDFINSDFGQHTMLFLLVLAVVFAGVTLHAPAEVISPLSQGLGMSLPALLGAHGIAVGVRAWKDGKEGDAS